MRCKVIVKYIKFLKDINVICFVTYLALISYSSKRTLVIDGSGTLNIFYIRKINVFYQFVGEDPLEGVTDGKDINSIAGVLKLYFRELREPLFPLYMFDEFIAASSTWFYLRVKLLSIIVESRFNCKVANFVKILLVHRYE